MEKETLKEKLLKRIVFKLTSGKFIFTIIIALVYAFLACYTDKIPSDKINEITLICLYAYFTRRMSEDDGDDPNDLNKDDKE